MLMFVYKVNYRYFDLTKPNTQHLNSVHRILQNHSTLFNIFNLTIIDITNKFPN